MTMSDALLMSGRWTKQLSEAAQRRQGGLQQTHTQCAPHTRGLSVENGDLFLSAFFDYYNSLPGTKAGPALLNSITEKLYPDTPFPFFIDLDFDVQWFAAKREDPWEPMTVEVVFELIKETIEVVQRLCQEAFGLEDSPECVISMRTFYKCHLYLPEVFVTSDLAAALARETCRVLKSVYRAYSSNLEKAIDCGVYTAGLRTLGSHKGNMGAAGRIKSESETHAMILPDHPYGQIYLVAEVDFEKLKVSLLPLTLDHLMRLSVHRRGEVRPVSPDCSFAMHKERTKRKFPQFQRNSEAPALQTLNEDAGWEDVARAFVSSALREAQMDPTVTRVRRYANTGFIEVTLSPRECPMKNAAHKRTQDRNGSANYVLVGQSHCFLRCWKCEGSIQLEDTPTRLMNMMDMPAHRRYYPLFASLHDNTHELVSNVIFDFMKETYSVVGVSDNKYLWYYFDHSRHRWIQYEKVMTSIMEDKGDVQNMWTQLVKDLKSEMVPPEGADQAGGKTEIYETVLLRKLIRNLQNVGFIKHSIMALLARKIDWHWKAKTPNLTSFQELLNSKNNLIGFTNGVYDTRQCVFRAGSPSDFVSKSTGVEYIPWDDYPADVREELLCFLRQVQSVPEELDYVLWAIASSFRGDAAVRQAFYFWIGMGSNGKSTLIRLINQALGEYACETPVTLFTRERPSSEKPCPDIVATRGCRFASAPEPGLSDEFVMSTLKWLSGSDKLCARKLNENMQSWYGTATYHCGINGIPLITSKDEDYGTWRRLNVLCFASRFVPNPSGPREFKKMESAAFEEKLMSWGPAFSSLLIKHMQRKEAPNLPPAFKKATEDLKLKNDVIGKFVNHSVTVSSDEHAFCEVIEAFSAFNIFKRVANIKGRTVTEEQFTLYISTNVAPLRQRMVDGKELSGWGIHIKSCGGERY